MLGQLKQLEGRWQLRFSRKLEHPPDKVWRALVEPEHLEAWFPTTVEGDRADGAPLKFSFREDEVPPMNGEMITYEPHSLLEFKWSEDVLRFELQPVEDGTLLTLFDTFDELGKAARDAAGWHVCLDLLEGHIKGAAPPADQGSAWKGVHARYVELLGPEAATIGPPTEFLDKTESGN
jgi:uncharacterized protein YndB with AHSA1/START domain